MQSRFLLSLSWVLASGIYLASCTSGGGSSGSNGGSSGQPVIDASGKKIYTVDPAAGGILSASGITSSDPSFANASVVIPPGALSIPVDISMFQAQSLASSSAASAVGSSNLTAAGPAVAILPSQAVSITNPLAISIPFSALTSLTGDKQIVVIAIYPGESKNELETFVGAELDLGSSGVVKLSVTRFGAFQVVYSDTVIEKIKVETEIKIEQKTASVGGTGDAAAFIGKWQSGCESGEYDSNKHEREIINDGDDWRLISKLSLYSSRSCQSQSWIIRVNQDLDIVESLSGFLKIDLATKLVTVTNVRTEQNRFCDIAVGAGQTVTLTESACQKSWVLDLFADSKQKIKVQGNMLIAGDCDAQGSNCSTEYPTSFESNYLTKVISEEPNFSIFQFMESPYGGGLQDLGPLRFGDCKKFILESDRRLSAPVSLAQNHNTYGNGSFYRDPNCSNPFTSANPAVMPADATSFEFYFRATPNVAPSEVVLDIRRAANVNHGVASLRMRVENKYHLAASTVDSEIYIGQCYEFTVSSLTPVSETLSFNPFMLEDSPFVSYGNLHMDSDCSPTSQWTAVSQQVLLNGAGPAKFFFKPTSSSSSPGDTGLTSFRVNLYRASSPDSDLYRTNELQLRILSVPGGDGASPQTVTGSLP